MDTNASTGPYPPGQVNPWLELELRGGVYDPERYHGLGLAPLAIVGGAKAAKEAGVFQAVGDFVGDLFGHDPDKDPEQLAEWARATASGQLSCPGPFNMAEAVEAVRFAPEGRMGDPPAAASRGGLRQAILQRGLAGPAEERMAPLAPYVGTPEGLARIAVGVAHGRIDCGVGWDEQPAAEHLEAIVSNYRARARPAMGAGDVAGGARPMLAGLGGGDVHPLVWLGLGGAVLAFVLPELRKW